MPKPLAGRTGAPLVALVICVSTMTVSGTPQGSGRGTATMTWDQVAQRALKELSDQERRGAAVYLDEVVLAAGGALEVDRKEIPIRRASAVVFVDQDPRANWGHASRYLVIGLEDGSVQSIDSQFPPFLRSVPKTLRLIWKGPEVPEWAVAKPPD